MPICALSADAIAGKGFQWNVKDYPIRFLKEYVKANSDKEKNIPDILFAKVVIYVGENPPQIIITVWSATTEIIVQICSQKTLHEVNYTITVKIGS